LRRFRDVTRNVKGPIKRRKLQTGKILRQRLKTTPINSCASNQNGDPKGFQAGASDLPRAVQSNIVFPVPENSLDDEPVTSRDSILDSDDGITSLSKLYWG
jgi:hypothetical protein